MMESYSTKVIDRISFGLLPPEVIRKISVLEITNPDTYDEDGFPIERGLMDTRLGVIDPGLKCRTCGGRMRECPGHFGHIELARPVIHVEFAKNIYQILKATCPNCRRLTIPEEKKREYLNRMKQHETKRLSLIEKVANEVLSEASSVETCPYCGEKKPKIKFERPTTYIVDGRRILPNEIREWLEEITDEDAQLMGINPKTSRPEWMVITVLPVPPVTVRPSITLESGVRAEDDLTHKLVDIIRINQRLRENIEAGAPQLIIEDLWDLLQYHVTTYLNNEVSGVPPARHRSGRALKTLAQRLKGKEGRFRGNLSGKRVDFSARTVISPDPWISINEVGVPVRIAMELTVPERVTEWNIEEMRELVKRGPENHPGANYIIRPDGKRVKITDKNRDKLSEELGPGYIVERHLKDGDVVLFNRQPSLHRMSIMAHIVRVMPYKTFRPNLCVCPPYNADFDGDEMNLHVPQSEEARAEARILMLVQEHIISPRFGGPIIGTVQDYISGGYLLSLKDSLLTKEEAQYILYQSGIDPSLPKPAYVINGREYWTGRQLISKLLPKTLNIKFETNVFPPDQEDGIVEIRNGEFIRGVLDKNATGALERSELLHVIAKEYGNDEARRFLDAFGKMTLLYIMKKGFTTGVSDEDLPEEALERIDEIINEAMKRVEDLIRAYEGGELEPLPGKTLRETLEMRIMQVLAEARDRAGEIAGAYLGLDNHAVIMAKTGAKGSMLNLTQMAACLGQQSVRGERISRGYRDRTLSHFKRGDIGAKARGFVKSSYKKGLDPIEFFFHAMGGREGLVDTAVRTAQSGYMQRRLINALQDLKVEYDGTVRDTRGAIVQLRYGEDGVDPAKSDRGVAVNIKRIIEVEIKEESSGN